MKTKPEKQRGNITLDVSSFSKGVPSHSILATEDAQRQKRAASAVQEGSGAVKVPKTDGEAAVQCDDILPVPEGWFLKSKQWFTSMMFHKYHFQIKTKLFPNQKNALWTSKSIYSESVCSIGR